MWYRIKIWSAIDEDHDLCFITYGKDIEEENHPPFVLLRPSGPVSGKKNIDYTYYVSAENYEGDQIYYRFDGGNNSWSDWFGPYDSDESICASYN